ATAAAFAGLDLVFLCTPAEASMALAPVALEAGARVVDLSGAFRLSANEYPRWYGFTHARPELLPAAWYSGPEAGASGDGRPAGRSSASSPASRSCAPSSRRRCGCIR